MPETAAFTPAPKNRPLQALFAAIFIVPQLAVYAVQDDHSAYEELASLFRPALELSSWQRWLQDETFLLVLFALSLERIVYTIVWLFPNHFVHFAQYGALRHVGRTPLDVIVFLFSINKVITHPPIHSHTHTHTYSFTHPSFTDALAPTQVFQIGSIFGYFFHIGPLPSPSEISLLRWVLGLQLFIVGQGLNFAIYRAIGKSGVYYGFKIGVPVPWCTGFPFNVFTMHPQVGDDLGEISAMIPIDLGGVCAQYAGVVMSLFGGGVLMLTPHHARGGFVGVGVSGALC